MLSMTNVHYVQYNGTLRGIIEKDENKNNKYWFEYIHT